MLSWCHGRLTSFDVETTWIRLMAEPALPHPCSGAPAAEVMARELLPRPLLVAAACAVPDLHGGAVGGAGVCHVEAQAGLAADDGAVCVEGPLLVGAAVAVPDLHPGARGPGVAGDVEALVAVHLQGAVGQGGPSLVRSAVAVPDRQLCAVGVTGGRDVEAPVGGDPA